MTEVQGVIAAAVTPRTPQGDINLGAAFELIDHLCAAGVQGIALFTPAGEFGAVTAEERSRLVYLAVKRSRVPLLVGVGAAALDISAALGRGARDAGAAALLVPPPQGFAYDPDDVHEYYLQVASQVGTGASIFLSRTPGASQLTLDTTVELLATRRFAGVEDGAGPFDCWRQAAEAHQFSLLCADDRLLMRALASGVRGAVSPVAGAVPELSGAIRRAVAANDAAEIARLDALVQEFLDWTVHLPQPAVLKAAVSARGIKAGPPPAPLSAAKQRKLEEFRAWFAAWLPVVKKLSANA